MKFDIFFSLAIGTAWHFKSNARFNSSARLYVLMITEKKGMVGFLFFKPSPCMELDL